MDGQVNDTKIESYMLAAAWISLSRARDEAFEALRLLDEQIKPHSKALSFKLLAVRRYLRIGDKPLDANWSWTDADVTRQRGLEPTRTLYAEAAKVQANFKNANAGYRLDISPVRSLERQVALWADNSTVRAASIALMRSMHTELLKSDYPEASGGPAALKFAGKLKMAAVVPEPTSAAPGTSGHGRGTAVDFVIMRGSSKIAGTDSSDIGPVWDARGWSAKLKAAVQGTRLKGPLKTPYEPWHWSL